MSFTQYFKELLSRPSPRGCPDDYLLIMRSYMQKHLAQVEAAEHRMHLTAFGAFLADGFVGGILMLVVLVGLYGGR